MALNFWFGKKDAQSEKDTSTLEMSGEDLSPHPVASSGTRLSPEPPAEDRDLSVKKDLVAEQKRGAPTLALSSLTAPSAAIPLVKPVPPPVATDASSPVASRVVLKAVQSTSRSVGQPAPATRVASVKPTFSFGLRPREDKSAPPALAEQPVEKTAPAGGAVHPKAGPKEGHAEDSLVRPKTDQRALYYQLMNGLYDGLLILDDQGHVVDCSTRVEELVGYAREESWDLPIEKIIPGMTSQMFQHLKQNLTENNHILIDARCHRKDKSTFACEVGVSTLSLTRGSNMVFAIRNVERRKNMAEDLKKSRAALEVALAPTFICDLDGGFLSVNSAMLEAFGIPDMEQAMHVRFMDLLPDAARFFLRATCGEKIHEKLEINLPTGQPLKLELAMQPVQSGNNTTAIAGSLLQL